MKDNINKYQFHNAEKSIIRQKHLQPAQMGKNIILQFLRDRMEERKMTIQAVADRTGVPRTTLSRNFSGETEITLENFLKVLGALEIRPYLIPAETDKNELQKMFFN